MKANMDDILSSCLLMSSDSSEYSGNHPLIAFFLAMSLFEKWIDHFRLSLHHQVNGAISSWEFFLVTFLLKQTNSLKFHSKWRKVGRRSVKGQDPDYHLPFVAECLWK